MNFDWKLAAALGAVFAFSAFMPIESWLDCRSAECPLKVMAREEQRLARRDPDKRTFYYWPIHDAGSARDMWFVYLGDHLKLVSIEDGVETYTMDKWFAVEGPDILLCRLTVKFRGGTKIFHEKEEFVPQLKGYC